jgi:hypothetical protein
MKIYSRDIYNDKRLSLEEFLTGIPGDVYKMSDVHAPR